MSISFISSPIPVILALTGTLSARNKKPAKSNPQPTKQPGATDSQPYLIYA
jgi:hypothetical protein